jgi:hypothetical protein
MCILIGQLWAFKCFDWWNQIYCCDIKCAL